MTFRESLAISANTKKKLIFQEDLEDANSLANQPPGNEIFYTLNEIAVLTEDLMGIDAPTDINGRILEVRPKGHWFEFEVAKRLGYNYPPGGGLFPDIRHQALEIKHHTGKSITVDFGRYHPSDRRPNRERLRSITQGNHQVPDGHLREMETGPSWQNVGRRESVAKRIAQVTIA